MLDLLWIALVGFVVGLIARAVHPGKDDLGIIMTVNMAIPRSSLTTAREAGLWFLSTL